MGALHSTMRPSPHVISRRTGCEAPSTASTRCAAGVEALVKYAPGNPRLKRNTPCGDAWVADEADVGNVSSSSVPRFHPHIQVQLSARGPLMEVIGGDEHDHRAPPNPTRLGTDHVVWPERGVDEDVVHRLHRRWRRSNAHGCVERQGPTGSWMVRTSGKRSGNALMNEQFATIRVCGGTASRKVSSPWASAPWLPGWRSRGSAGPAPARIRFSKRLIGLVRVRTRGRGA